MAGRGVGPVDMKAQDQVGPGPIGEPGPVGVVRTAVGPAGEQRLHAHGGQAALEPGGEVHDEDSLLQPVAGGARVAATVPGVEDDDLAGQRDAGAVQRLALAHRLWAATRDQPAELFEGPQRGRPAHAVAHQAVLPLEAH